MGIMRKTLATGALTAAAAASYLSAATIVVSPLPPKDPVWTSKVFKKYNAYRNPCTQDVVRKYVPLDKIRPELLEKDGDLVVEFTRGVWTGLGHEVQRRILEYKNRNEDTETDLWEREQLETSTYEPGTIITDHFEVVEKTATRITVRCGDSPRNPKRGGDGLFSFEANVDRDRGVVELGLKSTFFNSAAKVEGGKGPMGPLMERLHQWYARFWLVTGYRRLLS